jgi:hypothetical protein
MNFRALLFPIVLIAAAAQANVVSRFDSDLEGWSTASIRLSDLAITGVGTATWNSGGWLEATEFPGDLFVLVAPAKFLGNQSAFLGGTVSFRLSDETNDGIAYPSLLLRGGGVAMFRRSSAPTASGTNYVVPLSPAGWLTVQGLPPTQAQFEAVLANIDAFGINADWTSNTVDKVTLDNVVMAPVPEPATLAALGLGLVAIARRRRK